MDLSASTVELIGGVAAVCTTAAFVPQLVRVWKLRRAEEISAATFLLFAFGTAVWLVYGLLLGSLPIILANAVTVGIAAAILALKFKWDRAAAAPAAP
jgi:MtN3 and saliva related transmembrane protein